MKKAILLKPLISEKTLKDQKYAKYAFLVARMARKEEIKSLVESLFKVHVLKINTSFFGKEKKRDLRHNKTLLKLKQKKALVTLKKGEKIDIFEISDEKEAKK